MLWESRTQPKESGQGRLPGSYVSLVLRGVSHQTTEGKGGGVRKRVLYG